MVGLRRDRRVWNLVRSLQKSASQVSSLRSCLHALFARSQDVRLSIGEWSALGGHACHSFHVSRLCCALGRPLGPAQRHVLPRELSLASWGIGCRGCWYLEEPSLELHV